MHPGREMECESPSIVRLRKTDRQRKLIPGSLGIDWRVDDLGMNTGASQGVIG